MEERPINGPCESPEARDREFAALPEELQEFIEPLRHNWAAQQGPVVILSEPQLPFGAVPYPHCRFSIFSEGLEIASSITDVILLEMVLKESGLAGVKLFILNEVIVCLEGVREAWRPKESS